jgi:lipoprotein-releasing system permease protein
VAYELFIANRYLRPKRRFGPVGLFTVLAVAGVLVGVTALVCVLSVMNGFENEVQRRIVGTNAHVIVLRYGTEGIADADSLVGAIRKMPNVLTAAPFIYTKGMISSGGQSDGIVVKGIRLGEERSVTEVIENIHPPIDSLSAGGPDTPPDIVLGRYVAENLRVVPGELVLLTSPFGGQVSPFGVLPRVRKFRVAAIFTSGMYEYDSSLAFVALSAAQEFFQMGDRVTAIEVKIKNLYEAPRVGDEIVARLGGFPYRSNNWIELNQNLFSWMKLEKIMMFLILTLIVLVAALNIVSALIMMVIEKRRDIGVLKSMGATGKSIRKIFVLEGLVIGAIGTVGGCVLGFILSYLLDRYKFISLPADVYFIDTLPVKMEPLDFLMVALWAMLLCFLATLYPAWKASRLVPVEAIRYE